ncbi:uncharacterized protein LOC115717939 [Cannabis sativa]|uniref:uncharacterized protein LOC115717939 n=1 Tax=Cannabis sativa TaxID=3483 RepID=UPI0029CA9775|nr:uncharacterized protein LOC115717939 [Cannabis sativa]
MAACSKILQYFLLLIIITIIPSQSKRYPPIWKTDYDHGPIHSTCLTCCLDSNGSPKHNSTITVVQVEKITKALREFGGYDFMATILERNLQSVQTYCDEFLFFVDRQNRFTIYGNNTITLFVPPDEAIRFKEWNSFDYQIVMSKVDREAFELGHLSKGSTLVPASVKQKLIVDEVRDDGTVLINRVEINHWNIYNDGHVMVHGTENFFNHLWGENKNLFFTKHGSIYKDELEMFEDPQNKGSLITKKMVMKGSMFINFVTNEEERVVNLTSIHVHL